MLIGFIFLNDKDLDLETEQGKTNLNERDYSYTYYNVQKAKDGTSGVMTEHFLIWVSESDFIKEAHAEQQR